MPQDRGDRDLLRLEVEALYVLTDSGRLVRRNVPDHEAAPRLRIAGCRTGNDVRIRHDVGEASDTPEGDRLLEKVGREGQASLTARERRVLEDYSRRMRQKRR